MLDDALDGRTTSQFSSGKQPPRHGTDKMTVQQRMISLADKAATRRKPAQNDSKSEAATLEFTQYSACHIWICTQLEAREGARKARKKAKTQEDDTPSSAPNLSPSSTVKAGKAGAELYQTYLAVLAEARTRYLAVNWADPTTEKGQYKSLVFTFTLACLP